MKREQYTFGITMNCDRIQDTTKCQGCRQSVDGLFHIGDDKIFEDSKILKITDFVSSNVSDDVGIISVHWRKSNWR